MMSDLQMMMRPDLWPKYPVLPVKNSRGKGPGQFPDFGVVTTLDPRAVLLVPIDQLDKVNLNTCERKEYPSLKAMVDDGWQVD